MLNSCCELTFSDLIRECARDRTVHILNFSELAKILDYFVRLAQRKVSDGERSQFRRNDVFDEFFRVDVGRRSFLVTPSWRVFFSSSEMAERSRPDTPPSRPESPLDQLERRTRSAANRLRRNASSVVEVVRTQSPRLVNRAVETVRQEARAISRTNLGVACR